MKSASEDLIWTILSGIFFSDYSNNNKYLEIIFSDSNYKAADFVGSMVPG